MTPLVHGRRTPRRLPPGGVLGRRFSVWDAMGYHGIAWASINGPLTGRRLKEWLRSAAPSRGRPRPGPHEAVARGPQGRPSGPRRSASAVSIAGGPLLRNLSLQGDSVSLRASQRTAKTEQKINQSELKRAPTDIALPAAECAAVRKSFAHVSAPVPQCAEHRPRSRVVIGKEFSLFLD